MFSVLPHQFGRYEVKKKLGQGGMGAVYLAHDSQLHRPVALKIPSIGADQPAVLARFRREARAAAILHHPGICPVFDVGEIDGIHYLAMAYIEGKPLSSFVDDGKPLPVSQAVGVVRKLAMAMQEAHKRGVVHRDLKPSNIMIDRRGQPIIMDFGLARVAATGAEARLTRSGSWLGTPAYMSPEQFEGDAKAMGPACDIYSLGVILYELLTGRLPFDGPTVVSVFAQVMAGDLAPPSTHRAGLDPALDAICCKAMARNSQDRYASTEELATDLTAFLKGAGSMPVGTATGSAAVSQANPERMRGDVSTPGNSAARTFAEQRQQTKESAARRSWATLRSRRRQVTFTCIGILSLGAAAFIAPRVLPSSFGENVVTEQSPAVSQSAGDAASLRPSSAVAPFTAEGAKQHQQRWADYLGVPVEEKNSLGMTMVLLPPGEFRMGSTDKEIAAVRKAHRDEILQAYQVGHIESERPLHRVAITKPFYVSAHEVTRAQFRQFADQTDYKTTAEANGKGGRVYRNNRVENDPQVTWKATNQPGDDHPVVQISWDDATAFCEWLSAKEGARYTLLTEAQWEYACRAGSQSTWYCGDDKSCIDAFAWHSRLNGPSEELQGYRSRPVGRKNANAFGLFDMHGNVQEWCADWFGREFYSQSPANDPVGPPSGVERVTRGGTFSHHALMVRSGYRSALPPSDMGWSLGFRVAKAIDGRIFKADATQSSVVANQPPASAKAPFSAQEAKQHQKRWADYLGVSIEDKNSLGMAMVLLPAGEFMMGSTDEEIAAVRKAAEEKRIEGWHASNISSEQPRHSVQLTQPFWISATEVTYGQFKQFVERSNYQTEAEKSGQGGWIYRDGQNQRDPSLNWRTYRSNIREDEPVAHVAWQDCVAFCEWLSKEENHEYALPTEAQWEYACRAGSESWWHMGNDEYLLDQYGWTARNHGTGRFPGRFLKPVALKQPNSFGLYDMHGNGHEWCADWGSMNYYSQSPMIDPAGPAKGQRRALRGGGFASPALASRSASRWSDGLNYMNEDHSFRVVKKAKPLKPNVAPAL